MQTAAVKLMCIVAVLMQIYGKMVIIEQCDYKDTTLEQVEERIFFNFENITCFSKSLALLLLNRWLWHPKKCRA